MVLGIGVLGLEGSAPDLFTAVLKMPLRILQQPLDVGGETPLFWNRPLLWIPSPDSLIDLRTFRRKKKLIEKK